jgi:hypothetical protein
VVFSTAVHVEERFFMEQDFKSSSGKGFLQDFHHDHVLVDALACFQEEWTELKLIDGDFVVSGLDWDTQFQEFVFDFLQDVLDFMWDLPVVMV